MTSIPYDLGSMMATLFMASSWQDPVVIGIAVVVVVIVGALSVGACVSLYMAHREDKAEEEERKKDTSKEKGPGVPPPSPEATVVSFPNAAVVGV